jgi:hypothetical protein
MIRMDDLLRDDKFDAELRAYRLNATHTPTHIRTRTCTHAHEHEDGGLLR